MKQNITLEQLKEIKDLGKFAKLYKLIRNKKEAKERSIIRFYEKMHNGETKGFEKLLAEINNGKMHEILNGAYTEWQIYPIYIPVGDDEVVTRYEKTICVTINSKTEDVDFEAGEICDAYWGAVKFMLVDQDESVLYN